MKRKFELFDEFCIRIPIFPYDELVDILDTESISDEQLLEIWAKPFVKAAVRIASISIYDAVDKQNNKITAKNRTLFLKIFKYFIRMSTRCTPFGLFSAVGTGKYGANAEISLDSNEPFYSKIEPSFEILNAWVDQSVNEESTNDDIKYFSNDTIYNVGSYYRYYQRIISEEKSKYKIYQILKTDLLEFIREEAKRGISFKDLLENIYENAEGINRNEIKEYLNSIIEKQFLKSEVNIKLTSENNLQALFSIYEKYNLVNNRQLHISSIVNKYKDLSSHYPPTVSDIDSLKNMWGKIGVGSKKAVLNANTYINTSACTLDYRRKKQILRIVKFLSMHAKVDVPPSLKIFKEKFYKRYESEKIPLTLALDRDLGIGYDGGNFEWEDDEYLKGLIPQKNPKNATKDERSKFEKAIESKIKKAIQNQDQYVKFKFTDFDPPLTSPKAPATFYCLHQFIKMDDDEKVYVKAIGNTSGTNALTRFCYDNKNIFDLVANIICDEQKKHSGLLAEIIHLPSSDVGHLLRRPNFRKAHIPILSESDEGNSIFISDLMVFIENEKLKLYSKSKNSIVEPILTNTHNYTLDSLNIYTFLCDMHRQKVVTNYLPNFDYLLNTHSYCPRVEIEDFILSPLKWKIEVNDIKKVFASKNYNKLYQWLKEKQIPDFVNYVFGDRVLFINIKNQVCIDMLFEMVSDRRTFILEEYFTSSVKVKLNARSHNHEIYSIIRGYD